MDNKSLKDINKWMNKLVPNGELLYEVDEKGDGILNEEQKRSLRKEEFRKLHKEARNLNENVMERYYGITANGSRPVLISEVTLDRVLKKHGSNGMINISANKSQMDKEYNDNATKSLISDLKQSGYSYLPTYGGYRDENGLEDDYEPSFVVFNYTTDGKPKDFEELKNFGIELCKKYKQDSVLIKAPNVAPVYVNGDGEKINDTESNEYWKNDPRQAYFTSFKSKDDVDVEKREKMMGKYKTYCHQNNIRPTEEGFKEFFDSHINELDSIGGRYTYDINFAECYVNPMPNNLTEQMRRQREVMIWE